MYFCYLAALALLFSCSHNLVIESTPAEAEVYSATSPNAKDRKFLGKTPLSLPFEEVFSSRSGYLILTKQNFERQNVFVDRGSMTSTKNYLIFNLLPGNEKSSTTSKLIAYVREAQTFAKAQNFIKAHERIDDALREDPTFVFGVSFKGGLYYLQGNYSESQKQYERVLDLDPANAEALKMLKQINLKRSGGGG